MEIPHRGQRPPLALPSIHVHDSNLDRSRNANSRSNSYNSVSSPITSPGPMSIPNAREQPPPPLPPPRHIQGLAEGGNNGQDLAWQWGNSHRDKFWGQSALSVDPRSSLHGSFASRKDTADIPSDFAPSQENSIYKSRLGRERENVNAYPKDEGYSSLSSTSIGSTKSRYQDFSSSRGFQSSVHDKFRSNAQAYDKSLLQKLDARRGSDSTTPPRGLSTNVFSTSANDSPTSRIALEHRQPILKPLSLPLHPSKPGLAESPLARWGESSNASSPVNTYPKFSGISQFDYRSPSDTAECERSPLPYNIRRSGSGSAMSICEDTSSVTSRSRESYDQRSSPENDVDFPMEEASLKRLHIDDYSTRYDLYSPGAAAGQKRRASSPPRDEGPSLHTVGSASDLFRRRESASRSSPSPHFHSTSGSVSSTASGPRSSSYISTLSLAASNITNPNSYGRLSPGVSPGATDTSLDSPYMNSMSSNPSPQSSISRTNHQRTISETRPLMTSQKLRDNAGHVKHNSAPKIQGVFICECCPKKPKKFDSQEELNIHEQEKQYECAYCRNRFKNKNEAERHQNSLHLRRHSWSCAALSGYAAAFHPSPSHASNSDTCGYCGEEFPRSGTSSPSPNGPPIAVATEQDWDIRIVHLQEMHKFGECNHAKKFFRADHFRQHLKHSHAGTSGKWTNMLENACMKDEPLPEPINRSERVSPGQVGGRVGRINEEEEVF